MLSVHRFARYSANPAVAYNHCSTELYSVHHMPTLSTTRTWIGPCAVGRQRLNAAARLSADARKYDHVTPLLMDLHWLRVPERVKFKLRVLMHRCLTGAAPRYLTELAVPVASNACHRLCSTSSADLVVPSARRSTIRDRAFAVAGPRAWNT